MGAHSYRELVCFQLADELQRRICKLTAVAPASNDFRLCNQPIAKGSLAETQVQLRAGLDRNYFNQNEVIELLRLAARCDRATSGLRAYLSKCDTRRTPRT